VRRFPHGATNGPPHPRPSQGYGQLPFRPGPGDTEWPLDLPVDVLWWADVTVQRLTSDAAEVDALWVLDDSV
jgi:hypothetical protein